MDLKELLTELGGVATYAQLVEGSSRADLDRALASGVIVRKAHNSYVLPGTDAARAAAHALHGVLCLTSAALHHEWAVRVAPEHPQVAIARNRKLSTARAAGVDLHRYDLLPGQVADGIATDKETTLTHCLRSLPYADALAIADSALRAGDEAVVRRVAQTTTGAGAARIRRVARAARAGAANPFESALRAISHDVRGLNLVPQVLITSVDPWAKPDLVDVDLRIVAEADSFEWHGDRAALRNDARRYDLLVADGWLVLRFAWEDVIFDPDFVRQVLMDVTALARGRTQPGASASLRCVTRTGRVEFCTSPSGQREGKPSRANVSRRV